MVVKKSLKVLAIVDFSKHTSPSTDKAILHGTKKINNAVNLNKNGQKDN